MKKIINKNKVLKISLVLLSVLVLSLIVALGVRLGTSQSYTSLTSNDYVVGTLDSSGEFQKDPTSFVTEDYIEIDGLNVNVKEDAKVSYKLYFFTEDKEFISATNSWVYFFVFLISFIFEPNFFLIFIAPPPRIIKYKQL